MDPRVEQAARTLARTLRAAGPVSAFLQAEATLRQDAHALGLIRELQRRQQALAQKQQDGSDMTQAEIDELRRLQEQVRHDASISRYVRAQAALQEFLPRVVQEISALLGVDLASLAGVGGC